MSTTNPTRIALIGGALALAALPAAGHAPIDGSPHAGTALWNGDPWVTGSLMLASLLYLGGIVRLWGKTREGAGVRMAEAAAFATGMAVLAAALVSPIDALGAELFSMHMVQHELMMLVAAPLMVAGKPLVVFLWAFPPTARQTIARRIKARAVRAAWRTLTAPPVAWLMHALILWAWHFPALFQAGLASDGVHAAQHFSFLVSALLFWSSLMISRSQQRDGGAVLSILSTTIHTGILGALLTFSPRIWYPAYTGTTERWGMTALEDQQLGGLIMWVPAGFVLLFSGLAFAAMAMRPASRQWSE